MTSFSALLDILCIANEGFWLYQLPDVLYEKRNVEKAGGWRWLCGFVLIFTGMIKILEWTADTFPYIVPVITLCTLFVFLFWKCKVSEAFAVCGGYFFADIICSRAGTTLAAALESSGKTGGSTGNAALFAELSIWLLGNLFLRHCLRKQEKQELWKKVILAGGLCGFSFFAVIFGCSMLSDFLHGRNIGWYFFFTVLLALSLWGYFQARNEKMQEKVALLDMQNRILQGNYDRTNSFYIENAKLYHDMNHHLDAIGQLLKAGNSQGASAYIESLREPLAVSGIPRYSGTDVVDAVLYEAKKRAGKNGQKISYEVQQLPQDITIEKKDLCALFANVLDNALEAAEKEIRLSVEVHGRMLFLVCENDYSVCPVMEGDRLLTGKPDKLRHGWGTQIVRQIVEKYDGSMEYITGESFRVEIMVNL